MGDPGNGTEMAPWRGMLLYLVLGVAWVFAGDVALAHWVDDPALLTRFQTWKGWGYVLLTSGLAWWMLRRMRRAEKVRLAMAQELSQIVRHAPAGFARVAPDGRILWANARLCNLLGLPLSRVLGLNFRDLVPAPDRDWAAAQLARLLAGEIDHYVDERECQRPGDGRRVPVLCTVTQIPGADGEAPHDVTFYLRDLASAYHSYYDAERILVDDEAVKKARLALVAATAQVLHNGLAVLGVSAPARM